MKKWKYVISSKHEYENGKVVETMVTQECDLSELPNIIRKFIYNHENVTYEGPLTIVGETNGKKYIFKCGYSDEDF